MRLLMHCTERMVRVAVAAGSVCVNAVFLIVFYTFNIVINVAYFVDK